MKGLGHALVCAMGYIIIRNNNIIYGLGRDLNGFWDTRPLMKWRDGTCPGLCHWICLIIRNSDTISVDLYTKPTDSHQYLLPTSCHPKHCLFLTALHFASNVSAPIQTPLNQEQKNWLTTSANGVIRNRKFHLPWREHDNKREKTYFL